jgi:hypothetical protein
MSHLFLSIQELGEAVVETQAEYAKELETYGSLSPEIKAAIRLHVAMAMSDLIGKAQRKLISSTTQKR